MGRKGKGRGNAAPEATQFEHVRFFVEDSAVEVCAVIIIRNGNF